MTNDQVRMTNDGSATPRKQYDLEERTALLGERAVRFARTLPQDAITRPLISQFVRAATSVGANYCEADDAESRRDFRHKIALCRKESRETRHWLRMLAAALPDCSETARDLWRETQELNRIFGAIGRKLIDQPTD